MWIIPVFSLCTGCDSRSPRLRPLSWLRPGSGIPSISTAYAQARRRCAQVIHMFVHRQQEGSPVAWLAGSSRSARLCSRARPACRMRGSGPGRDEIAPGRQLPDDRRQEDRQPAHPPPPARPAHPDRPRLRVLDTLKLPRLRRWSRPPSMTERSWPGRCRSWSKRGSRLPLPPGKRLGRWMRSVGVAGSRSGWARRRSGLVWTDPGAVEELRDVLRAYPGISWVQLPMAGIERVAEAGVLDRRRRWTSAKGAYAEPVAEHALALLLAGLRYLPERARARSWGQPAARTHSTSLSPSWAVGVSRSRSCACLSHSAPG